MNSIQITQLTADQFREEIRAGVESILNNFLKSQVNSGEEIMTRQEVADLLQVNLSTVHNWCKRGKLKPRGIGNRVYFKRSEVEACLRQIF